MRPGFHQDRPVRGRVGEQGADEGGARDPLGGEPRQLEQVLGARREARHHRSLGAARVHHGQAVAGEFRGAIAARVAAAVGAAVAEPVHRQHPEVAREVGDLHLPVARVDQRPGRQQEDGLLALAVDLVEERAARRARRSPRRRGSGRGSARRRGRSSLSGRLERAAAVSISVFMASFLDSIVELMAVLRRRG